MLRASLSSRRAAVWLALFVTFLWSTSWVLIRWGLDGEELAPLGFAAMRYGLAAAVLVLWVSARGAPRTMWRDVEASLLARVGGLGLVLVAATQGAQFVAIDSQPAATTSLVLSATPLLVAALSSRTLAEPPSPRQVIGGGLVLVGAALYLTGDLGFTVTGMVAAGVALVANAIGSILGRSVNRSAPIPAVDVTALSMTAGAAALAVASVAVEGWPTVSGRALAIIGWLAIVNTALAFALWNSSLRQLTAVESAGINSTMLAQIALLAWVFLDEPLGWDGGFAVVLVSLGVFLTRGH
ncbi:MAG: DMT family transporter [Actinomycetota bacterium]